MMLKIMIKQKAIRSTDFQYFFEIIIDLNITLVSCCYGGDHDLVGSSGLIFYQKLPED